VLTLDANTTGRFNTAIGALSLQDNTTGEINTAVGYAALANNTTGASNTAVGYQALYDNTTGSSNTALGHQTLQLNTAPNNTAVGYQALFDNTTGDKNVALGSLALNNNTTGYGSVAIGYQALYNNTIGSNVAIGHLAAPANTTGSSNVAIGAFAALYSNQTGSSNIAIGSNALENSILSSNTAIGHQALLLTTGSQNTSLGREAGDTLTTGSNNTLLGYNAQPSSATVSNEVTIGNDSVTVTRLKGNVGIGTSSPSAKLQVNGASLLGSPATFYVGDDGGSIGAFLNQTAALPIRFNTSGVERMRIDSSGNLLVGLTAASYATTTVPKLTLNAGNSSATTIQGMPCGLAIVNSHNGNSSGYGSSIKFHMSGSTAAEVTKYAAIAGIADSTFSNTTALAFYTNSSAVGGADNTAERMRIKANGNVGIGTSSPSGYAGAKLLNIYGTSSPGQLILEGGTGTNFLTAYSGISAGDLPAIYYNQGLRFGKATSKDATGFVEAMRIDSSGNVLVAGTSFNANGSVCIGPIGTAVNGCTAVSASSSVTNMWRFYNPNGNVGTISTSGSATSYVTSSDYRLKENILPMIGALNKVLQLKPCTYTWKSDSSNGQGFIAHELAEIVPDAVVGKKDAVDEKGNPIHQGVDTSFLVATLTAAIQELAKASSEQQAIIETLTTRIEALENK
jgi:trimeric autotransporter adhesin